MTVLLPFQSLLWLALLICSYSFCTKPGFAELRLQSFQTHLSGLFGEVQPLGRKQNLSDTIEWQVYVDQSKTSLDRGGSATLDAFCSLASPSRVQIIPAVLPKSKNRFPWIRCISTELGRKNIDVGNVDSVDKVYRVLTKHLEVPDVTMETCDCLKWKYKGNSHLEAGRVDLAIEAYNRALTKQTGSKQEGVILLLRASAFLQQAQLHKQLLTTIVKDWKIPDFQDQQTLLMEAANGGPGFATSVLRKIQNDGKRQKATLRQIQYRHGLYQYALLHAAQDSLRATEILPNYSTSFLRAGEVLSELWKLKESQQYYEKAMSLDRNLYETLEPILGGLKRRQDLLDQARATREWPEDSLRLALDVAV